MTAIFTPVAIKAVRICQIGVFRSIEAQTCDPCIYFFLHCKMTMRGIHIVTAVVSVMIWCVLIRLVMLWGSHVQQHSEPTRATSFSLFNFLLILFFFLCRRSCLESCIFFVLRVSCDTGGEWNKFLTGLPLSFFLFVFR